MQVDAVDDGQQVLHMLDTPYDLIFMDCHMPVMDGFEATSQIRKREEEGMKYTPIIAMTALAMAGDRERCIAAGMDDV